MANENLEQWGASATVEQETVRAAVIGLAEGKLKKVPEVPKDTPKSKIRTAPNFAMAGSFQRSGAAHEGQDAKYTSETIATYLGWNLDKVTRILRVLEAQEVSPELVKATDFSDLSTRGELATRRLRPWCRLRWEPSDSKLQNCR